MTRHRRRFATSVNDNSVDLCIGIDVSSRDLAGQSYPENKRTSSLKQVRGVLDARRLQKKPSSFESKAGDVAMHCNFSSRLAPGNDWQVIRDTLGGLCDTVKLQLNVLGCSKRHPVLLIMYIQFNTLFAILPFKHTILKANRRIYYEVTLSRPKGRSWG